MPLTTIERPSWMKVKATPGPNYQRLKGLMRNNHLLTVCKEALWIRASGIGGGRQGYGARPRCDSECQPR